MPSEPHRSVTRTTGDWLVDCALGAAIGFGRILPRDRRVPAVAGLGRRVMARTKFLARAEEHLAFVWPDMPPARRREIALGSIDNMARTIVENLDPPSLLSRARGWTPEGPGVEALDRAQADGRPAIIVSGHFGNWEAARAALTLRGHRVGALFRPFNNGFLMDRQIAALEGFGVPAFPRGRQGLRDFLRHLKDGGMGGILIDQFVAEGVMLDFLGQPAPTTLSAAELALRYDAPLIPFYGIRRDNGLDFDVVVEGPVPAGTPEEMMQAVNDSLSVRITEHPDQWLWPHRRWKHGRIRRHKMFDLD
ncbi:lauroyl acyltransferase [Rhodobacterales bacterium HKCCE3408]|nr:lauroyl acyltransferase [Rhodobacterales bacterium HKCCE3408]